MFAYVLLEVRRALRETGYLVFGIGMPLLMYVLFTHLNTGQDSGSGSGSGTWTVLSMVGLAAYGGLGAAVSVGTGVADDKSRGWLRQLRVTPLSPQRVVVARALTGSVTVLPAIGSVLAAGALINDVRLAAWQWLALPVVLWLGTLPFTLLGIGNGYRLSSQTTGVVNMACMVGLSVLGGLWFPIQAFPSWLGSVARWTPSHAFAQLGWSITDGGAPGAGTVGLTAAWFALFCGYAVYAYRRSARTV
jgi:ABC-2 type transport system permease protein